MSLLVDGHGCSLAGRFVDRFAMARDWLAVITTRQKVNSFVFPFLQA